MTPLNEADPIWGQPAVVSHDSSFSKYVDSPRCGRFRFMVGLENYISGWNAQNRAKICTYILDMNNVGDIPTLDPPTIQKIEKRPSIRLSEKIDRFLLMLDRSNYRPGDLLPWRMGGAQEDSATISARHKTMLWMEAASEAEFYAFGNVLLQAGIISKDEGFRYHLAPHGYELIDSIARKYVESEQAFVAMWFDESMNAIYNDAISLAVQDAGYTPQRIDRKEHSNKIDDEIIGEIRKSKFVIADFTSYMTGSADSSIYYPRGGVYFEAGFALGLGIPVIWSVRIDQINHIHFDTRQYNHIAWADSEDLRTKLFNRISAVIGLGKRNG